MVLRSDGTVRGWGWNAFGQLGTGNTTDSIVPVLAGGGRIYEDVSAGYLTSVGLGDGG
jgi:alpha-tubulin suppressor-like RCC1 family protein